MARIEDLELEAGLLRRHVAEEEAEEVGDRWKWQVRVREMQYLNLNEHTILHQLVSYSVSQETSRASRRSSGPLHQVIWSVHMASDGYV